MRSEIKTIQLKKRWKKYKSVSAWVEDEVIMFNAEEEDVEEIAEAMARMLEIIFTKKMEMY